MEDGQDHPHHHGQDYLHLQNIPKNMTRNVNETQPKYTTSPPWSSYSQCPTWASYNKQSPWTPFYHQHSSMADKQSPFYHQHQHSSCLAVPGAPHTHDKPSTPTEASYGDININIEVTGLDRNNDTHRGRDGHSRGGKCPICGFCNDICTFFRHLKCLCCCCVIVVVLLGVFLVWLYLENGLIRL